MRPINFNAGGTAKQQIIIVDDDEESNLRLVEMQLTPLAFFLFCMCLYQSGSLQRPFS